MKNFSALRQTVQSTAAAIAVATTCLMMTSTPAMAHNSAEHFAESIEQSHQADVWYAKSAVQFEAVVAFGGNTILDATIIYDYHANRVRITLKNGVVMVFDGDKAWVSPADTKMPGPSPRFHLLTWPYFLALPFKLQDPGTHLAPWKQKHTAKLTFGEGVGDSPKDWYVLYRNPKTNTLDGTAYIVTYGKSVDKAEADPHAVRYEKIVDVEGVKLATEWEFFNWSPEQGFHGDPLGHATLSNIQFITPDDSTFAIPEGAAEDQLPAAE